MGKCVNIDVNNFQILEYRTYLLETMIHQLSIEVSGLYKDETWASEPQGVHGFITILVRHDYL